MSNNKNLRAVILITSLFFLWGLASNLNPILIPHLKKACRLTDFQSALIDSAFYIAYFVMALPAGLFMKKYGYKGGIIFGLLLFATGAFLFYPAAETLVYAFFLGALFIIACGLAFLETAANPYITVVGDQENATFRLNLAQSFNGAAAFIAPLIGRTFILSGKNLSGADEAAMSPQELNTYLHTEALSVQMPYIIIGLIVLTVAFLVWRTHLPDIIEQEDGNRPSGSIWGETNLLLGVLAQFFYVGAQVCVSSFFIRFSDKVAGLNEHSSAGFLSVALLGFMIGRFFGTALMKVMSPAKLLGIYAVINFFLLLFAVKATGMPAIYALIGVEFFMSIMFPTIFSLSIRGLGSKTKIGSSLVIMSIVGGAVFPLIMGAVSDRSSIQASYIVPAVCFLVILFFAFKNFKVKSVKLAASH